MIADVVVVGGGGAGLAAASEAARLGRSVILLEKNARLGGSTAWSIGSVTATNTPHQRRLGIKDTPDEQFEDLGLFAGPLAARDNLALRRLLVDNMNETFDWLLSIGVVFIGPMPEPPNRYPRMHNVVPSSRSFPYHLGRHARRLGVEIRTATPARELVVEEGRVAGVAATSADGQTQVFRARNAVVLASGDYSGGRELKARYASELVAGVDAVNVTNTGDGHLMALALGASVVNGDIVRGPVLRFVMPQRPTLLQRVSPNRIIALGARLAVDHLPPALLRPVVMSFATTALGPEPNLYREGAILVNAKGERFTDELGKPALDLAVQPGGNAWIVLDAAIAAKFTAWPHFVSTAPGVAYAYLPDYRRNRRDIYHEASSIEGLARNLAMEPATLARTVSESRARAAAANRPPLAAAPFVALGPIRCYVTLADGGLKVSDRLEVLGEQDIPIPGLYAAGAAGQGGLILNGHGHHLGWAFASGRIAGRHAALCAPGSPGAS